ncbi:MAG: amidohydrolase [Lachnospiraceae bacterium]|jgi:amidohydrolase|nr:amidohydrolase [Lachnospiraceae bacterium]
MEIKEIKKKVLAAIDEHQEEIIRLGEDVYCHPELGYKELFATEAMEKAFASLGVETEKNIAYTGCKASVKGKEKGPKIDIMGELDSITCPEHPDATKDGNVHACGHNVQLANLFGAAAGLIGSGVMKELSGAVDFVAIPAEECVDLLYRENLKKEGKISFVGGKQEYLSRGSLDDTDIVLQCHMMEMEKGKRCILDMKCTGFMTKTVKFIGKSAHAGFAPQDGVNALNMAELAMNNIHAIRETFLDEDKVRVSMIMQEGGSLVNVVPSVVTMEIMVRAFTIPAILDANKKVSRALKAAAFAIGGQVEITDNVGYLPLSTDPALSSLYKENMIEFAGANEDSFVNVVETAGSTDLGDISLMKPCMHIWSGGITGGLHTGDYRMKDKIEAYVTPAKMLALTIVDLLYNNGEKASKIISDFKPEFTTQTWRELMDKYSTVELFDGAMLY